MPVGFWNSGTVYSSFARGLPVEDPLKVIHVHAAVVGSNRGVRRLAGVERDHRPQEGRVLGDHRVTRVEHQLPDEVEALLPSLEDEHVVGRAGHAVADHARGDVLAQRRQPVRDGVLERDVALLGEQLVEDGPELLDRELVGVGVAAGERDDAGIGAVAEQIADGIRLDLRHAARRSDPTPV